MTKAGNIVMIVALLVFNNCSDPVNPFVTSVEQYLNEVIDLMRENHVRKDEIDWEVFKSEVFERAQGAQTIADTNESLLYALELLDDQSSFIVTATGVLLTLNTPCDDNEAPAVTTDPDIGYVKIPAISESGRQAAVFAEEKQNEIKAADKPDLKGWIVDLRGNTGGNLWPMIAAVGPILGEGVVGYFIDGSAVKAPIKYEEGSSVFNEDNQVTVLFPYSIVSSSAKVAVLVDHSTSNAGEAVAITFSGKPNTRIFGAATCGQGGGNQTYILSDGSVLFLNVAFVADRNENTFTGPIQPDELVEDHLMIYDKAVEWINE